MKKDSKMPGLFKNSIIFFLNSNFLLHFSGTLVAKIVKDKYRKLRLNFINIVTRSF